MKKLIAAAPLALLLVACTSQQQRQAAPATTAAPTTTAAAATTTTPPTTAKPNNELGKTKVYTADDGTYQVRSKITVLDFTSDALIPAYRNDPDAAPRKGFRYAAIQVRVCLVSTNVPEKSVTVAWDPWNLSSKDGDTYQAADSYSTDTLISPLYPNNDKETAIGQCRKGWIPFAVPNTWRPETVEYSPEAGGTLTWQL